MIVLSVGAWYIWWYNTLEGKIARRQRRSEKKNIRFRAENIVGFLADGGSPNSSFRPDASYYSDGLLAIGYLGEASVSISIKSTNEIVFSQDTSVGGRLESYIPGAWETHFDALYRKAEQVRKALFVRERTS